MTLEGWVDIMYYLQDAYSSWVWVYFVALIVVSLVIVFSIIVIYLCLCFFNEICSKNMWKVLVFDTQKFLPL